MIDRLTGWYFEPRLATFTLDGRGTPSLEPPVPSIRLDELRLGTSSLSLAFEDLVVVGAPVAPGFAAPRFTLRGGRAFPRGEGNVVATGLWGYTEDNGTPEGRTPLAIRRACMLLVLRSLSPLSEEAAFEARSRWRIIEERTRDQSYKLSPGASRSVTLVGDPEIDALLVPYLRPAALGAA